LLGETGEVEVPARLFGASENGRIDAYIRPHELDLSHTPDSGNCLTAKVIHVNPAGSIVKVRLMAEDFGLMLNVDLTPERYRTLSLKLNESVYVTPKAGKIFEPDYTI
jgi:sulfate transport system ATP-binding protein